MKIFSKTIEKLIQVCRWIGITIAVFMMVFIFIAVIAREFNFPILGDVELVQLSMVVLIMFALSYTETENAHISIGLLVDRLPQRAQAILDILANILIAGVSWVFAWVFYHAAIKEMLGTVIKSALLEIPEFPFKLIIAIGTFLWGLVAISKIILISAKLVKGSVGEKTAEEAEELWV